jgi:biopolymer transport protein ExbB/TolQ
MVQWFILALFSIYMIIIIVKENSMLIRFTSIMWLMFVIIFIMKLRVKKYEERIRDWEKRIIDRQKIIEDLGKELNECKLIKLK